MNALLGLITDSGQKLHIDDLSLYAQSVGGAQALLEAIHEFEPARNGPTPDK
jgi:hypothetical protein